MDDKISADNEVDESRLLLFKAHAVVTIAAAAAVSETPLTRSIAAARTNPPGRENRHHSWRPSERGAINERVFSGTYRHG
jgi:hypothetical protein